MLTRTHWTIDQFEFEPDRLLVPALVRYSMYRPDLILCWPGFNFDGAARLFTVPGLFDRPHWLTGLFKNKPVPSKVPFLLSTSRYSMTVGFRLQVYINPKQII